MIGKDTVGILAKVAGVCAQYRVNIVDVSQTVMQDLFCMIMLCEIGEIAAPFGEFVDVCGALGRENHLSVHVMHEDIFNSMHRI